MAAQWYTIQVQGQLLETAAFHLRRQNFEPFFPRIEIRKSRREVVVQPMFKGYGFVKLDLERDQWLSVNGTRGVVGLLPRHADFPAPMSADFVERLVESDPVKEEDFLGLFEEYFPGITVVEVADRSHLLYGRRGLVVGVRNRLLQVSFNYNRQEQGDQPVWVDKHSTEVVRG